LYLRLDRRRKNKYDARASTNQREQYGGTVHLFIGTGCSLCEIIFIPFTIDYNHDINYHESICLFIFKSVQPFVLGMSLYRSSLEGSFGVVSVLIFRRCFLLQDLRLRSRPPTGLAKVQPTTTLTRHTGLSGGAPDSVRCARLVSGENAALGIRRRRTAKNHWTVRWCTGLSGESSTTNSSLSRKASGRRGYNSPDCPVVHRSVR
jgi:hypothetical protein